MTRLTPARPRRAAPPVLPLDAAIEALDPLVLHPPAGIILHQYWDSDPPRQIEKMIAHNAKRCRAWGMTHRMWTQTEGVAFLEEHFPEHLDLFRRAPHPAMACDLLRLCILYRFGGLYLDADMALRPRGGERLPGLLHDVLLFKWTRPERTNVPNWCFGFRAGHPMLAYLISVTARTMAAALERSEEQALKRILQVSGPALFTRAVGSWIASEGVPPGFVMPAVDTAYEMVMNGPEWLKAPLDYKKTTRHWYVAAGLKAPG